MHIVIDYCYIFVFILPFSDTINLLFHSYFVFEIDISFEDIFFLIPLFFLIFLHPFFVLFCSVLRYAMRSYPILSYPILSYHPSLFYSPFPQHHPSLYQTISRLSKHILLCDGYSHPRCTVVYHFIFTMLI